MPAGDIDLVGSCKTTQHDRTPRNTASSVAAFAPLYISTSEPEIWTFAAIWPEFPTFGGVISANPLLCACAHVNS